MIQSRVRNLGFSEDERFLFPFHSRQLPTYAWPIVVVGAGAAGAAAALAASESGREVLVLRKGGGEDSNTFQAQGGIAAVLSAEDHFDLHIQDTLEVGCGLSEPDVVSYIVREGPEGIRWLRELGVPFDQPEDHGDKGSSLSREGGHSRSRVFSSGGDSTGQAIQLRMNAALQGDPRITVMNHFRAVDLLVSEGRCIGVLGLDANENPVQVLGGAVILATGASGQIYRETTNPDVATADGLAMAFRAGASVRDMEFFQFHPTTLYIAGAARVLISEAVRGAGAVLRDRRGDRVMEGVHPLGDLAPRDVVSRAILDRMVSIGDTNVFLDATGIPDVKKHFPQIARMCASFGIDITQDPIPVRPGAHYMVGGVQTDLKARSDLPGLFACGEVASSGLHGANRLASNSLLEAIVLGRVAGCEAAEEAIEPSSLKCNPHMHFAPRRTSEPGAPLNLGDMLYSMKSLMWREAGLLREGDQLRDSLEKLRFWEKVLLRREGRSHGLLDLRNMLLASRLLCLSALSREESRGTHFRKDFPEMAGEEGRFHTVLRRELHS
ncbi:MAG TPA: L-aspartate oxidase [Planctomycetes bacterium]|nr:L-aspartate oxidase [Planctomycetota bacterium]